MGLSPSRTDLGVLGGHVDQRVRRDASSFAVGEPLEQVGVAQRAYAHGRTLVVDLAVQRRYLELADVLRDGAHLAVADLDGRLAVDDRNLVVVRPPGCPARTRAYRSSGAFVYFSALPGMMALENSAPRRPAAMTARGMKKRAATSCASPCWGSSRSCRCRSCSSDACTR